MSMHPLLHHLSLQLVRERTDSPALARRRELALEYKRNRGRGGRRAE